MLRVKEGAMEKKKEKEKKITTVEEEVRVCTHNYVEKGDWRHSEGFFCAYKHKGDCSLHLRMQHIRLISNYVFLRCIIVVGVGLTISSVVKAASFLSLPFFYFFLLLKCLRMYICIYIYVCI